MNNTQTLLVLLAAFIALVLLGRSLRRRLPDHHLSADSRDAVKLAMGLVATMTALLLGLLVSSAKGTYDTQRTQVIQMAAKVTFLDRVLAAYGADAAEARAEFRATVSNVVQCMWPDEAAARLAPGAVSGEVLYATLQQLTVRDDTQRALKAQALALAVDLGQLRMLLLAQMEPSIPRLLLLTVMAWLGVIFLGFSLLAPPNATTTIALLAAAICVAGAVFLILELDQPMGGVIHISSSPLRHALSQHSQ